VVAADTPYHPHGSEAQLICPVLSADRQFVLTQPSIFVSHGAPDLLLSDAPARGFLETLLDQMPERPKAILVASAHWETRGVKVSGAAAPETIYDFGGFAPELYQVRYPALVRRSWPRKLSTFWRIAELPPRLIPFAASTMGRGFRSRSWRLRRTFRFCRFRCKPIWGRRIM
jgi:hypothetical protein